MNLHTTKEKTDVRIVRQFGLITFPLSVHTVHQVNDPCLGPLSYDFYFLQIIQLRSQIFY